MRVPATAIVICLLHGFTRPALAASTSEHSIESQVISFNNGAVTLKGLLLSPTPTTSLPTIIMVHGSGPSKRASFGYDHQLVRMGFPVLTYDKRGVQESTGDWKTSSLEDLAKDALAAVNYLKARQVLQIGLLGFSQGGWIVPWVAAHSNDVDFIIMASGAGVTPAEQELFRQEKRWRKARLSEDHIRALRSAWARFYDFGATGKNGEQLDAEISRLESVKVLDDRRPQKTTELPADALVRYLGYHFDPLPLWEKVRCPVLAFWGEKDVLVPVHQSAERIADALKRGGNTRYEFKFFSNAGHGLLRSEKERRLSDGWIIYDWEPAFLSTISRFAIAATQSR